MAAALAACNAARIIATTNTAIRLMRCLPISGADERASVANRDPAAGVRRKRRTAISQAVAKCAGIPERPAPQAWIRELATTRPAPRYESATTHAAAVSTQETMNSPHCEAVM